MLIELDSIKKLYENSRTKVEAARQALGRPLSLAEKILFSHLDESFSDPNKIVRGKTPVKLWPDRVAMQDATAQMAMLQFISTGRDSVSVPCSIHCDHLIRANVGAEQDVRMALKENKEVYDFLRSSAKRYGIDFWQPGSGIIHQVVLENYACPGALMIGTDSHTPNMGGIGMIAIGVGGADAAEVVAGLPWAVPWPKLTGIKLTGELNGWTAPKDIILKVASILTVKGGTGKIIEYFGSGARAISATGRSTVTNMGAEIGATTSVFPFDSQSQEYLRATKREELADLTAQYMDLFEADAEVEQDPDKFFDEVIEIDLSQLEPHVVGPHTPDLARPISALAEEVKKEDYPDDLRFALVGSCTNSSYEDISRSSDIAEQAAQKGVKAKIPFMITPGSEAVHQTIRRDGMLEKLTGIGATVLANACGPCIGQWKRTDIKQGERNSIITSFNRNFRKRNDGNAETLAFIGSPEIVTAFALSGSLSFNPLKDKLKDSEGNEFLLEAPNEGNALPNDGFVTEYFGFEAPNGNGSATKVEIADGSERLAFLEPFKAWDGQDFDNLPILVKALGKCTTDHISPAGPWLKYRGHLDKISDNCFIGAINAFSEEAGRGLNVLSGEHDGFAAVARAYKAENLGWAAVGDENYGEGSSREHAAMSPRFLGAKVVIARSFARIAETNLKKQGVLATTFADPAVYDQIQEKDRLAVKGLANFAADQPLQLVITQEDGSTIEAELNHSYTDEQIEWFKAGSALNTMKG